MSNIDSINSSSGAMIGGGIVLLLVLGLLKLFEFGSNITLVAALVSWPVALSFAKPLFAILDDDSNFADFLFQGAASIPLIIFFSAPFLDEEGYCIHQKRADSFEAGPATLAEALEGESNTDYLIRSDYETCMDDGGWAYASSWEAMALLILTFIAIYWLSIVAKVRNAGITVPGESLTPNLTEIAQTVQSELQEAGLEVWIDTFPTYQDRSEQFEISQEIFKAFNSETKKAKRKKLLGAFERWTISQWGPEVSDNRKKVLIANFEELIAEVDSLYSKAEISKETSLRRKDKLTERVDKLKADLH